MLDSEPYGRVYSRQDFVRVIGTGVAEAGVGSDLIFRGRPPRHLTPGRSDDAQAAQRELTFLLTD